MTEAGVSDRELMRRTRRGDTVAFRTLFDRKHRRVYLIAYQVLGDPGQAEEVAQEVFLALWRHCGRYRPRFAVDTWLTRIATNRAIDRWRHLGGERRHRVWRPERGDGEPPAEPVAAGGGPEDVASWRQLQEIWDELARGLPPQQRAAFALREIEGLDTGEVAEALGCSPSTVRSHVAAARETLQATLAERYPELVGERQSVGG